MTMTSRTALDPRPDRRRFLELRRATLARVPGYRAGPRADAQLASLWARAETLGLAHLHHPEAQLLWFRDPETWFGGPATLAFVDRDPSSEVGLRAALAAVQAHEEGLDETTWLEVDAMDLPLVHGLLDLGFGIDSVQQVGDARVALQRIAAEPLSPTAAGIRFEAASPSDIPGILALHRQAFEAHPEHCFFGARPAHLRRMQVDLTRALGAPALRGHAGPPLHWVVRAGPRPDRSYEVVAHVEADLTPDHPQWGAVSGMALVFHEGLQGRGLARLAYRTALAAAVEAGAETLKGGTSQPAVMALGRAMERPWYAFGLRREAHFPPEHFLAFHPGRR
ncbi:MAG: hypothetical protein U1F43_17635 [Myxococcota bacterium]